MTIPNATILIVEDEANMRRLLELDLGEAGFQTLSRRDAETGLNLLQNGPVDLVLTDLKLPGMNGLDFLQAAKRFQAALPVIVMTAFGTVETAVEAMKAGASDYVLKPFSLDEMRMVVHKELDVRRLREENRSLREALQQRYDYPNVVARSAKMQEVLALVERVAPTHSTVLLGGESGVGKDLIARAIHENSSRASGPFIKINSTAIPENLLESELFGYEKGAFTGATTSKPGKFELADKGTLFLDEIGDVPPATQVKLLRVLQEREFERLGGTQDHQSGCAAGRRHQSRPARRARRGHLSRGPLLPAQCRAHRYSAAARAQGRHSRSGEPVSRALRPGLRQEAHRHFSGSSEDVDGVSLAGQCARTGEYHRARLRVGRRAAARSRRYPPRFTRRQGRRFHRRLSSRGQDSRAVGRRNYPRSLRRANGNKSQAARLLGLSRNALRYRLEKIGIGDEGEKENEE